MDKKKLMKIAKRKINFIRMPIQNTLFRPAYKRNKEYKNYYENYPVLEDTILYESRDGKSITDNPYAIFKYLLNNPNYKQYNHIWTVQNLNELSMIIDEYKNYDNVSFVVRNTKDYLKVVATSKYLISNATFQSFVIPRKDQVYINTWHGTPLKNMGFKIPGNPANSKNVVRNFLSADYLISPNSHTTKMYTESYKMSGLYSGNIIEEGYPRNDLTLNTNNSYIVPKLRKAGLTISESKQTVLYAPTWKGKSITNAKNDMYQIISDMAKLKENISSSYNILIKVHPYLYDTAKQYEEIKDILVPDYMDTNELLAAVDILITDYSSIFFDFLVTGKPILFYVWDAESYEEERGSYFSLNQLPGPKLYTILELIETFKQLDTHVKNYAQQYKTFQEKFIPYDDGNVTKRLVEYIFEQKNNHLNIIKELDKKKEKLLFYPGGMMNNGITTSFINLLDNIDYDKYDVSCLLKVPNKAEALNNINKLNKNVRLLFRHGLPVYDASEIYKDKMVQNRGIHKKSMKKLYPEQAYKRELARYFGKSQFDIAIDFSGYSLFWAKYITESNARKKICFMHNDIYSERFKEIKGRHPHKVNLGGLFSIYNRFDKLVSVSEGTMELNRKNLSDYAPSEKFGFVMNSINPKKIIEGSKAESYQTQNQSGVGELYTYKNEKIIARAIINKPNNFIVWNNSFMDHSTKKVGMATDFENKEVTISWNKHTDKGNFYKFSFNNSVIGWLDEEAFTILPDSILEEREIKQVALLEKTKGNAIWNKPYKIYNTSRVSYSNLYKGMYIEVDKEVRTEHGFYSHFKLFGEDIGWIDSSALKIIWDYKNTKLKLSEIEKKKNKLLRKNYKKFSLISERFSQRALRNVNVRKAAKIIDLTNYEILSALPLNSKSKPILDYQEFINSKVELTQMTITKDNIYYLAYASGEKLGWINRKALKISSTTEILNKKQVKKKAEINFSREYPLCTKPFGMKSAKIISEQNHFDNIKFNVTEEVRTQLGKYSKLVQNDKEIGWINSLALKNVQEQGIEVGDTFIPEPDTSNINFVNMGRMSPEKAQDNLISAFAKYYVKNPNSRLYIIGTGILYNDLKLQIKNLGLENRVYLVGQLENPFKLLAKCDCFVLSSHYEGQPMVLLEAMTLGLDIIATNIVANRTVLKDGKYGLLVEDSVEGLHKGLCQFENKETKKQFDTFDYKTYNAEAMQSFYKVIR